MTDIAYYEKDQLTTMMNQQVKTYRNAQQFQRDARHMAHQGWQVSTSTVGGYRKASLLSWLLFGIFNIFPQEQSARYHRHLHSPCRCRHPSW